MTLRPINLLLADDDQDDCFLFDEALSYVSSFTQLSIVNDGEQLMNLLTMDGAVLPDVLFLDINMPRKSGKECMGLIKQNEKLAALKIIIYSTSLDPVMVDYFYETGAQYYLQKPADFSKLKTALQKVLPLITHTEHSIISKEQFVISV